MEISLLLLYWSNNLDQYIKFLEELNQTEQFSSMHDLAENKSFSSLVLLIGG